MKLYSGWTIHKNEIVRCSNVQVSESKRMTSIINYLKFKNDCIKIYTLIIFIFINFYTLKK